MECWSVSSIAKRSTPTPSPPVGVGLAFSNGLSGTLVADLPSFFVASTPVTPPGAGDQATVAFLSTDGSISASITTPPFTGGETAAQVATALNAQIALSPVLAHALSEDERLCWRAAAPRDARPAPTGPYQVDDRFGGRALGTGDPALLCRPSQRVGGPSVTLPTTTAFRATGHESALRAVGERLDVHTRFGAARLRVKVPALLAFAVGAEPPPSPDPIVCYAVKARERRLIVTTAIVEQREEILRIGAPRRFCVTGSATRK